MTTSEPASQRAEYETRRGRNQTARGGQRRSTNDAKRTTRSDGRRRPWLRFTDARRGAAVTALPLPHPITRVPVHRTVLSRPVPSRPVPFSVCVVSMLNLNLNDDRRATLTLRCVHTIPRGKMQHTAALPRGKTCSAYAATAIASTFFTDLISGYQNWGTRSANLA